MFSVGIAMQGKLYAGGTKFSTCSAWRATWATALLYFVGRALSLGRRPGPGHYCRLGHALHRCCRPAERDRRRGRTQSAHGEESLVFRPSHFAGRGAVRTLRFGRLRHHPARHAAAHAALWDLLFCAFRRVRDRAQLGDVFHRTVRTFPRQWSAEFTGQILYANRPRCQTAASKVCA